MDSALFLYPVPLLGLIGLLTFLYYRTKHRNIPPGPIGIPFLGYAPFLGQNPQYTLLQLGEKYGKVFSIYMGPNLSIVLNDYEAIKAAFVGQAETFAARPTGFVFRYLSTAPDGHVHGLAQTDGEEWKISRRFAMQTFRDLGMGKSAIQDRILEEAEYMVNVFRNNAGKPFDPTRTLMSAVNNVICALCFGKRFPHDHPIMKNLLIDSDTIAGFLAQAGPLQAFPWLRFLPVSIGRKWKETVEAVKRSRAFIRGEVEEHTGRAVPQEPRDYIEAFLKQQAKEALHGDIPTTSAFSDYELSANLRAFFGAGTETTSTTLLWAFLYMLHHPDIQRKVHKEIDEQVGRSRSITVEDRAKLPYTEAVIRECQRLGNVIPFGVLRTNREETTLNGYRIPRRCNIIPNFIAVNLDPSLWENPKRFMPERFLDSEGKVFEPSQFMPFSIGKRVCMGESLARMELFLLFANVMQQFTLRPAEQARLPDVAECITAISCRPLPYLMEVAVRTDG